MAIGAVIKEVFEERGMKVSALADRVGIARQSVYKLFQKDSIETDLLCRLGEVLGYDFFRHYGMDPESGKITFSQNPNEAYRDPAQRQKELVMQYQACQKRLRMLEARLEDKEHLIGLLQAREGKNRG